MTRVLIVSSREDASGAERLREALADRGFDVGHADEESPSPRVKDWDCVLLCWSRGAASVDLAARRFLKTAARRARLIPILLDSTPPPAGALPVDLSRWKGGRSGTVLAILEQRLRQTVVEAGRRRTWRRVFGGAGVVAIVFSVFEFGVTLAEVPSKLCTAGYAPGFCGRHGIGGVPSPAQEEEYRKALTGGCESLRRFIASAQNNPRRADAQAKYEARRTEPVESWDEESRELTLRVTSRTAGRSGTDRALTGEASRRAQKLCRGFEALEGTKLTASAAKLEPASCEHFSDGWHCSADGVAECSLRRRRLASRDVCR